MLTTQTFYKVHESLDDVYILQKSTELVGADKMTLNESKTTQMNFTLKTHTVITSPLNFWGSPLTKS